MSKNFGDNFPTVKKIISNTCTRKKQTNNNFPISPGVEVQGLIMEPDTTNPKGSGSRALGWHFMPTKLHKNLRKNFKI